MSDTCPKCSAEIQFNQRSCSVCNTDAGFPNVRSAQRLIEREALNKRYETAEVSARARGIAAEFAAFEASAARSHVVMNRSLGAICDWVNGQSPLFLSFHKQVESLGRSPSPNEWDQQREAAESAINPFCYRELNFAALSLDNTGMTYYGSYAVTLKSITIEDRSSIFEQNPFLFNRAHHVIAGRAPPYGYRASWSDRGKLAVAKLHARITKGVGEENFPTILMEDRRNESDCDFVEVHIYGPVNRAGIERIVGPQPARRQDRALWNQAARKAAALGAQVETVG